MRKSLIFLIILIIIGFGIYLNSFQNPFHFDDLHSIVRNPYIRTMDNSYLYFTNPRTFSSRAAFHEHYRPLLILSYAANYYLGKLDQRGYHIVNLCLHIGSAFLVFLILQFIFDHLMNRSSTSFFIASAAGLFFLATPFNSEVVNYITARSSVMSSFFYLLAFYCWVRYRSKMSGPSPSLSPNPTLPHKGGGEKNGVYFYIASLFAFILAMLTKETAITLPVIILIYDLYFVHRGQPVYWKKYISYLPFLIVGIFIGVILRIIFFGQFVGSG